MKYFLGFDTKLAKSMNLYTDELYLLSYLEEYFSSETMKESSSHPGYKMILKRKIMDDCQLLRHNNSRYITLLLRRLSGMVAESNLSMQYPVSTLVLMEDTYTNLYIRIDENAINQMKGGKKVKFDDQIEDDYGSSFYHQYKEICKIYDFKHNIARKPKVLFDSEQHIKNLLDGTFLMKLDWDNTWLQKQDLSKLKNVTFDNILEAVKRFKQAHEPGGWLATSKTRYTLSTFFYNPRSKKSMFLTMLRDTAPIPLVDSERQKFLESIAKFNKMFKFEESATAYNLYNLRTWWFDNWDRLVKYQKKDRLDYWYRNLGSKPSFEILMRHYTDYMRYKNKVTKYDVGKEAKAWWGFVRYMYNNYNKIRIDFADRFYVNLEEGIEEDYDE